MNEGNNNKKGGKQPMAQSALKKDEKLEKHFKVLDTEKFYESGFPKDMKRKKFGLPISDRLRTARDYRKLSLKDVEVELGKVKDLGIKAIRSTIQGYEAPETNANHRYPSLYVIYNLCRIYNVNVDYIFGFSDEIERPTQELVDHLDKANKICVDGVPMTKEEIGMIKAYARKVMKLREN